MAKKKFYMILDTETCGNMVFDYGYVVIDRKGNQVAEGSFVCAEYMDNPEVLNMFHDPFTKTKIAQYYFSLYKNNEAFTALSFTEIRDNINRVQQAFNATVCAYNAAFDVKHLDKTAKEFGYDSFFENEVIYMDIWNMALSVLCNSKNYLQFCWEKGFVTAKGHPQTGAEAVYCYLINDPYFEEKHTARADCEIEAYIFCRILRRKRKYASDFVGVCLHNPYWKIIAKRFEEF